MQGSQNWEPFFCIFFRPHRVGVKYESAEHNDPKDIQSIYALRLHFTIEEETGLVI